MALEEFQSKVKDKIDEWAGLLDEKAASLILLDELGRLEVSFMKIQDLQDRQEVSVKGTIDSVSPIRDFTRKDGVHGRVVNVELSDGTGRCRLALWDDDVRLVEKGLVKTGQVLRLLDCFVRKSNFGLEISRGKFGSVIVEE